MKHIPLLVLSIGLLLLCVPLSGCKHHHHKVTHQHGDAEKKQEDPQHDHKKHEHPSSAPSAAAGNTVCPVSGKAVDKNMSVDYQGKKVFFCCANCQTAFQENPEKFAAKLK